MAYESYNAYLSVIGNTPQDRFIEDFQALVDEEFSNATTIQTILHNGSEVTVRVVGRFNTESLTRDNDNFQKIIFDDKDYNVVAGDILEFDEYKWLVTDINISPVSKSCSVTKSTHSLTINKNGISSEVPIVIESAVRLYSLGQDSTKYTNTLSDEIIVYTPSSANIEVDDVYKIGKRNYKVMTVQDVLFDGLLVVKMEVTVEEVEEVEEPIEPPATGLFISPTDNSIVRNKTKVFTAQIFNNGVEDTDSRTIWLITNKDGTYTPYCTMSYNNRTCTLTASNEASHVGKVVVLRMALESDSSVYIEKEITIKSLI